MAKPIILSKDAALSQLTLGSTKAFLNVAQATGFVDESAVKVRIPTGLVAFDRSIGGGFPGGRITELFGPEASYKSGLAQQAMEHALIMNGIGVLYDNEQVFDSTKNGLKNYDTFLYDQKLILEEFYADVLEKMSIIKSTQDALSVISWDSLPCTKPKSSFENAIGAKDFSGAIAAMLHSDCIPKILADVRESICAFLVINQIRDAMDENSFDPWTTPGGKALKFYASMRVQLKPKGGKFFWTTSDTVAQGFYIESESKKNKVSPPFQKSTFAVVFDDNRGADPAMNILEELSTLKFTRNNGGYFVFEGLPGVRVSKRDFHEVYRDNTMFFLDIYHKLTGFRYEPRAEKAVVEFVQKLYAPKVLQNVTTEKAA